MSDSELDRIRPILEIEDEEALREVLGFLKSFWWLHNQVPIADDVLDEKEWLSLAEGSLDSYRRQRPIAAARYEQELARLPEGERIAARLKPDPEHFLLWAAELVEYHRRPDLSSYGARRVIRDAYGALYNDKIQFSPDDHLFWPVEPPAAAPPTEPFGHWLQRDVSYWEDPQYKGLTEVLPDDLPDGAMLPLLRLSQVDDTMARRDGFLTWDRLARRYGIRLFPALITYLKDPMSWGAVVNDTIYDRRFFEIVVDWPVKLAEPMFRAAFAAGWNDVARLLEGRDWGEALVQEFKGSPYGSPWLKSLMEGERISAEQAAAALERDEQRQHELVSSALGLSDPEAAERLRVLLKRAGRLYIGRKLKDEDRRFFSNKTHSAFRRLRPLMADELKQARNWWEEETGSRRTELSRKAGILTFLFAAEHFRRHRGGVNRYRARKLTAEAYRSLHGGDLLKLGEEEKLCWLGGKLPRPNVGKKYRHFFAIDHGYWDDPRYQELASTEDPADLSEEAMIPLLHFLYQDDTYLRRERFDVLIEELLARYGPRLYSAVVNYLTRAEEIHPKLSYTLNSRLLFGIIADWPEEMARPLCRSALASGWHEVDHYAMRGKPWRQQVLDEFADSPYRC